MIDGPSTREWSEGSCLGCGFPLKPGIAGDSDWWCWACFAGIPIYTINMRTEMDARLAWLIIQVLLHGYDERRHRPFPGDPVTPPAPSVATVIGKGSISSKVKQLDLLEYAGRRTTMVAAGADSWKGCCPIHNEKTASFHVWANPWRWRCFGACATGGDIIDLARELKKRPSRHG